MPISGGSRFVRRSPRLVARVALLALFAIAYPAAAIAKPLALDEIPQPLRAWTDWVLRGHESERCPFLSGQPGQPGPTDRGNAATRCAWPSRLELDLGDESGRFSQRWQMFAAARVALPGGQNRWPLDVLVDGRPAPVVVVGTQPTVELEMGTHTVTGSFAWDALPEMLAIPPETGLVALQLRGRNIELPDRDAPGRLWLERRSAPEAGEASRIDVVVHRRVIDEIPLQLDTRIELRVAGRSREALLGSALPAGFVPMALDSPLPARIDPDGRLRVQLRPGNWTLTLHARHDGPVEAIAPPTQGAKASPDGEAEWDAEEVWVFDARPQLRIVEVSGAAPVDPNQTTLPAEWRQLPAYLMESGSALQFEEKRRGDDDPAPDDLRLSRVWWLDFDGDGFTVTDRIAGSVRRSSRLEMRDPIELGRVAIDGSDQFITRVESSAGAGVEIPLGPIELSADSRVNDRSALSAVGWDHDFQALSAELWLPPGWRLFHASGVDRATATWLNRWTLLDLFVVLITAMGVYRLWGTRWGVLAIAALAVGYTEPDAPRWLWLAVLIGEGLRRALPDGRFSRVIALYRALALGLLLLVFVAFGVEQLRVALHPVLEGSGRYLMSGGAGGYLSGRVEFPTNAVVAESEAVQGLGYVGDDRAGEAPEDSMKTAKRVVRSAPLAVAEPKSVHKRYRPDPQARITTGPGLPAWSWNHVTLSWSGPVDREQKLGFVLMPPWLVSLFGFLRVASMAALLLLLLGVEFGAGGSGFGWMRARGVAAAAIAALLVIGGASPSRAEFPPKQLLDELRAGLLERPSCQPQCASIPRLRLEVERATLTLRLEVDAAADTAIPLPGGVRGWDPTAVDLDGAPARGLLRDERGVLWLRVSTGRHQVIARGPLPDRDSVELPLPLQPLRVEATSREWQVHGLREDGLAESALQLTREKRETSAKLDPGELPPFLNVTRELRLDLDWQLHTVVRRATPGDTALLIEVPLLAGESVTSDQIRVRDGRAIVSLAPGEFTLAWTSQLEQSASLELRAPEDVAWTEVWALDVSPIWHVETDGIPPIHADSDGGARLREWRPWPGESVRLDVARPAGVEGPTLTIDRSLLTVSPGLRSSDTTLTVQLRSSRGGRHAIALPEGASLQHVAIDGQQQPIRLEGNSVAVPIHPGAQTLAIGWRESRGFANSLLYRTPAVDLGTPSVNAQISLTPSVGRWILALGGTGMGPVVLFWSILVALAALALGLSRLPLTPLRFHEWLLLGVGLTQVPISAAAIVAVWLLVLGWRKERGTALPGRWFDLLQLALVALSGAALLALLFSIHRGLLGDPEMQIGGNGSTASLLRWYQDRASATPAQSWLFSVPLLVYRLAMLAWALWLAQALLRWLRWGWQCFTAGELWRPLRVDERPGART
jgi:hypothetical protein